MTNADEQLWINRLINSIVWVKKRRKSSIRCWV